MKQRIGAIRKRAGSVALVLVGTLFAMLLPTNRYSARPQGQNESQIDEEASSIHPLIGVTSSSQNPLQIAIRTGTTRT
jgi:hypothetical protein